MPVPLPPPLASQSYQHPTFPGLCLQLVQHERVDKSSAGATLVRCRHPAPPLQSHAHHNRHLGTVSLCVMPSFMMIRKFL